MLLHGKQGEAKPGEFDKNVACDIVWLTFIDILCLIFESENLEIRIILNNLVVEFGKLVPRLSLLKFHAR